MKWLPIILSLCGFNAAQAVQLSSIVEAIWLTVSLLPGRVRL